MWRINNDIPAGPSDCGGAGTVQQTHLQYDTGTGAHPDNFLPHNSNVVWSDAKLRFRLNVSLTGKGRKGPGSALFII